MKITKRQLSYIINEYYGSGIMDVPEDATPYERGYDDWNAGVDSGTEPEMPDDPEYMGGWKDADLDSRRIQESWYEHDQREEDERSEPPMGSFPHHWDQRQMDDWNQGFQDALHSSGLAQVGVSDEYMDGYEEGLKELETPSVWKHLT